MPQQSLGMPSGAFWTADVPGFGVGHIGCGAGIATDINPLFVSVAYGFSDISEGRIRLGYAYPDIEGEEKSLLLNLEAKMQIMNTKDKEHYCPFDLAVGALFEIVYFESFYLKEYTGFLLLSVPYHFNGHKAFPYCRFTLRREAETPDGRPDLSERETRAGLNLGFKYQADEKFGIYPEFQFDGNRGVFIGFDYQLF